MTVRTPAVALGLLAAVALSGCQKPTPRVLVKAGTSYATTEAAQYCRDTCLKYDRGVPVVKFKAGDVVGVDVPREVASSGWSFTITAPANAIGGSGSSSEVLYTSGEQDVHYATYSFPTNAQVPPGTELSVLIQEKGSNDTSKGTWLFTLLAGSR